MSDTRYLVALPELERELNRQMKELQGEGHHPLQRARMSNLVIFCNDLEQAILVNEQVPDISSVHPARTLLLVGEPGPERELTARVTVRPIGTGKTKYACAEQVTLHAGGDAVYRLPFAVRSLLIGDLPVNLWWAVPQPPALAGSLLHELGENAQQIIYDSTGWPDPARGVVATAGWLEQIERPGGRWRVASDLNWRRLKYWRRLVLQSLDPVVAPGAAESVTEVLIEHGPHAMVEAWMLGAWLASRLGWELQSGKVDPGVETVWRFRSPKGPAQVRIHRVESAPAEIRHVRIACPLNGKPGALNLVVEEQQRLSVHLEGTDTAPRTMTMPPHTAEELIGRQLSDRERDPNFRESMCLARLMAESVHA